MVVSRQNLEQYASTVSEVMSASTRSMSHSQRIPELPPLTFRERYGFSNTTTTPPLRVTILVGPNDKTSLPSRRLSNKYIGSYTDDLSAATAGKRRVGGGRRVRFELPQKTPPPSSSPPPSSTCGATILGNGIAMKQPSHVAGVDSWIRSRTGQSGELASSSSSGSSGHSTTAPNGQASNRSTVTATTTTTSRVHDTGRYRNGTLPPTANSTPLGVATATPTTVEILKTARDCEEKPFLEWLHRVGPEDDINAVDAGGRTAISYVASNGSLSMLEAILQIPGVDVNRADVEGNTPLHFAAQAGHADVVNFILSRCTGVKVDARNALGFTPLMKAALQGRHRCAKLLIFAGASPTLKDNGKGLRAEEWARFCGRYVCAEMIAKMCRHRLLDRSTAYGRWGSEPDLGADLSDGPKLQPNTQTHQPTGLKSRFKLAFRTKSSGDSPKQRYSSLVSQLTSAALCASTPVLPTKGSYTTVGGVRSMIRPLSVPKLHVTPASGEQALPLEITKERSTAAATSSTVPRASTTARVRQRISLTKKK